HLVAGVNHVRVLDARVDREQCSERDAGAGGYEAESLAGLHRDDLELRRLGLRGRAGVGRGRRLRDVVEALLALLARVRGGDAFRELRVAVAEDVRVLALPLLEVDA